MKISDTLFGIVLTVFAVFILIYSRFLPALPGYAYGSGFFPSFSGIFILGGGISLLVRGIRAKAPWFVPGEWTKFPRLVSNICVIPLNLVFYILVSDWLGFVLTSFLMMSATMWWLRGKIMSAVIISALCAVCIYAFFAKLLLVPLPAGLLGI